MYFKKQTTKKCYLALVVLLAFLSITVVQAQTKVKRGQFGIEIIGSILPKANISQSTSDYRLRSVFQSSYELGFNKIYSINSVLYLSTGIHVIIGKYNYFMDLPEADMRQYNIFHGNRFLEGKHLWQTIKVPLIITKRFAKSKNSQRLIAAGIAVRYSGFMTDFISVGGFFDTSGQNIRYFEGRWSPDNNGRPWTSIMISTGKALFLDNKNQVLINLVLDVSLKNFFRGDYSIAMPGKPVTTGKYTLAGSGLGVSIQYVFTGENKRLIRKYEKSHN